MQDREKLNYENWLKKQFPDFLKYLNTEGIKEPIAERGIEIGKGWHTLLENFCAKAQANYSEVHATQIKEKFNMLTIYFSHSLKHEEDLKPFKVALERAQKLSLETCIDCGKQLVNNKCKECL